MAGERCRAGGGDVADGQVCEMDHIDYIGVVESDQQRTWGQVEKCGMKIQKCLVVGETFQKDDMAVYRS